MTSLALQQSHQTVATPTGAQENFIVHLCNHMDLVGTEGDNTVYLLRVDRMTAEMLEICGASSAEAEPDPPESDLAD